MGLTRIVFEVTQLTEDSHSKATTDEHITDKILHDA